MRRLVAMWILLTALGPAACFSSSPPPVMTFFRLPVWIGVKSGRAPSLPAVLQVEALDVLPAYDRMRIVYRISPVQLRNYRLRQWVVKPGRLLQESLQRYFKSTGAFREVTSASRPIPSYVLRGLVVTLEQVERKRGAAWYAALDVRLGVYRASDGVRVWHARLQGEVRVTPRTPKAVVTAMTRLLRARLDRATPGLLRALRQDRAAH